MKITLKNTRLLLYLSLANILVAGFIFLSLFNGGRELILNILLVEFCLFFILTLAYFIGALLFFKEATAIVVAYTMFTAVLFFNIIVVGFPHLLKGNYFDWLSTLLLVISLLAAFRSFFVKNTAMRLPFSLFGAGLGLLSLPRLFALFVLTTTSEEMVNLTTDAGILLVVLSAFFILKRLGDYLKNPEAYNIAGDVGETSDTPDESTEI